MRAIQRVNEQDKDLRAYEQGMVVSARQAHRFVSRTATLLSFYTHQFPVCVKYVYTPSNLHNL